MRIRMLTVFSLCLIGLGLAGCSSSDRVITADNTVVGSGVVVENAIMVSGITGVDLAGVGNLEITQGAGEELLIRADDNLISFFTAKVTGGILRISRTSENINLQPSGSIEFSLTVTSLDSIMLTGVGQIALMNLTTPRLDVNMPGVGNVELIDLQAAELEVMLSGVGGLTASGDVDEQRVTVRGIGSYDARDLSSRVAGVRLESFGSAWVQVSDELHAVVAGVGSVFYIGNPTVSSTISGLGTVQQIPGP